jgi:hypothetical protein
LEISIVAKHSLGEIAYILALVGGILMVLFALLGFLGMGAMMAFQMPGAHFASLGAILSLILGVVAIVGSKHATDLLWAIILLIVGYVGGGIGGLLVLVGGILGLVSKYVH